MFGPFLGGRAERMAQRAQTSAIPKKFALLNAQWRGGSTLAEQLIFSTTGASPFLLDEPAKAIWKVCGAAHARSLPAVSRDAMRPHRRDAAMP